MNQQIFPAEEYASEGHARAYMRDHLGHREHLHTCTLRGRLRSAGYQDSARFFRIVAKLHHPDLFEAFEKDAGGSDWRELLITRGIRGIALPQQETFSGVATETTGPAADGPWYGCYTALIAAFDRIGQELFPDLPPDGAARRFRDMVGKAQLTGELGDVLRSLNRTFGTKAVHWLLTLSTKEYGKNSERGSFLLGLFADAGRLPQPERERVRSELISIPAIHPKEQNLSEDQFFAHVMTSLRERLRCQRNGATSQLENAMFPAISSYEMSELFWIVLDKKHPLHQMLNAHRDELALAVAEADPKDGFFTEEIREWLNDNKAS